MSLNVELKAQRLNCVVIDGNIYALVQVRNGSEPLNIIVEHYEKQAQALRDELRKYGVEYPLTQPKQGG